MLWAPAEKIEGQGLTYLSHGQEWAQSKKSTSTPMGSRELRMGCSWAEEGRTKNILPSIPT